MNLVSATYGLEELTPGELAMVGGATHEMAEAFLVGAGVGGLVGSFGSPAGAAAGALIGGLIGVGLYELS